MRYTDAGASGNSYPGTVDDDTVQTILVCRNVSALRGQRTAVALHRHPRPGDPHGPERSASRMRKWYSTPALAILVCADMKIVKHGLLAGRLRGRDTEHPALACTRSDSAACGSASIRAKRASTEIRRVITLPDDIIPFCLLPIGIPGETQAP